MTVSVLPTSSGVAPAILAAAAMLWLVAPRPAVAADDPAETACHQKDSTVAIVDCLGGVTGRWDKRLNAAYQAALKASENPTRKNALIGAERAWLAYRTANCGWYDAQEGTIRQIEGASCMLTMTRARATELEAAAQP